MSPKTPEFPFPSKRHRHHFRNHWLTCIPRRLHASHSSIGGVGGPHADAKHCSSLILSHNSDPTWWPRLAHQHRYYFPDFPGKNICPLPEWHVRLYDLKALSWLKIRDSLTHVECKILFYDVLIAVLCVSASPGYVDTAGSSAAAPRATRGRGVVSADLIRSPTQWNGEVPFISVCFIAYGYFFLPPISIYGFAQAKIFRYVQNHTWTKKCKCLFFFFALNDLQSDTILFLLNLDPRIGTRVWIYFWVAQFFYYAVWITQKWSGFQELMRSMLEIKILPVSYNRITVISGIWNL